MRHRTLEHRFVRNVPRELEPGVLYISMEYATAVHSCCCGCGDRVVTPLTPTDWRMTFDGESVSLDPSVGNWNQKCRSHYVIRRNRVLEADTWSNAQVEAERRRDKKAKAAYFGKTADAQTSPVPQMDDRAPNTAAQETSHSAQSLWPRVKLWLTG
jgi:Family of unknown function (DUF6527)